MPAPIRSHLTLVVLASLAGCGSGTGESGSDAGRGVDAGSGSDGSPGGDAGPGIEAGPGGDAGSALDGGSVADAKSDGSAETGSTSDSGAEAATPSVFPASDCQRFHFGTIDSIAQGNSSLIAQLDMFTSGWIGTSDTFNLGSVCTETNTGGALYGKVPALVSYIIGFTGRDDVADNFCLADCNATNAGTGCTKTSDLCTEGAAYIRTAFTTRILPAYATFAQGFAAACGTTRPMIWEMEPDFFQYYDAEQSGDPLTGAEAANYMSQMIATVKKYLPNAVFSMDTSPWMPNNGCSGTTGAGWYSYFDMSQFTFINTSGGSTLAANVDIRAGEDTWDGVHTCSGNKPMLADTGYGAAGVSAGPDPNWDVVANINARIGDGVISITQYNPDASTWGATIAANRSSLEPIKCY